LSIHDWLRLLQTRNLTALETITRVMRRHVRGETVTLEQAVELACAAPVPVARLGFELLGAKPVRTREDLQALARLAEARCESVAGEFAAWAIGLLGTPESYDVELVVRFFDALSRSTRQAAWAWLTSPTGKTPGDDDPALWSRLIETPYDDLRMHLVEA